ncbi:unnamed protein product [Cuscuta epithymum]|uniref:HAT C-terminal dimerisation domain-containing protein n=1 Tax=Cuscuta epithymum TaxID=186058 RepID=A0AAV0D6M2_9ASTE|nr:unnamed protein product [Cuscuta epithymum]
MLMNLVKDRVKQMSGSQHNSRSEFDRYLDEERGDDEEKDVLTWWKIHSPRFPVVARMARDILAIPVSTVASESAFSTGGRTLDQFRSSLTPKVKDSKLLSLHYINNIFVFDNKCLFCFDLYYINSL